MTNASRVSECCESVRFLERERGKGKIKGRVEDRCAARRGILLARVKGAAAANTEKARGCGKWPQRNRSWSRYNTVKDRERGWQEKEKGATSAKAIGQYAKALCRRGSTALVGSSRKSNPKPKIEQPAIGKQRATEATRDERGRARGVRQVAGRGG